MSFVPEATYFKPAGTPMRALEEITISLDEAEALRLKDLEGLEQEEGADRMGVSRPTFQRILASARQKIADALLNGKAIRIDGGNFELAMRAFRCAEDGHEWEVPSGNALAGPLVCPRCHSPNALETDLRRPAGQADHPGPLPGTEGRGGTMRIAISATGTDLTAQVDPRFGRSPHFIIFDPETSLHDAVDNASASAGGGAGIATAQMIVDQGVRAVLTGDCGPNAYQVLSEAGVQVITNVTGSIRDAIEAYKAGKLLASSKPSVDAHHGQQRRGGA